MQMLHSLVLHAQLHAQGHQHIKMLPLTNIDEHHM